MILNKKMVLAEKFRYCRGISKYMGLMFSFKFKKALIFDFQREQKIDIHMFFVFFPIDLLFLDRNKKVVEIKENLKPFHFYGSKEKARYVIELDKGIVNKSNTKVGDQIKF